MSSKWQKPWARNQPVFKKAEKLYRLIYIYTCVYTHMLFHVGKPASWEKSSLLSMFFYLLNHGKMHHISVVFLHLQIFQRIWAIARRWVVRQWVPDHAIKIHQMIKHQTLWHPIFKQPKETVHLWKVRLPQRSYFFGGLWLSFALHTDATWPQVYESWGPWNSGNSAYNSTCMQITWRFIRTRLT